MFKIKKFVLWILVSLILIVLITPGMIIAQDINFNLNSKSAILMQFETGEIIYEKNSDLELPPASMTKIMTMLLVMEALDEGRVSLDDKLVVSELAASMGGSQIWLEPGEEMTLEDIMKAIAIVSANDACVAVAEYLYGTEEAFVKRMNERAQELGLEHTYFYNTNGLPAEDSAEQENYTCARDLAVMGRELLEYPQVLEWTSTWIEYLRDGESVLNNTNRLVRDFKGADGIKTGYTDDAKFCLTSTAKQNKIRFIVVVMGADDSKTRFNESAKLLSYGFNTYKSLVAAEKEQEIVEIKVPNAREERVKAVAEKELVVPVKKGEEDNISTKYTVNKVIKAPLNRGDTIGKIKVYQGNLLIKEGNIIVNRDVARANFFQLVLRVIQQSLVSLNNLNVFDK
ncbi:MAG: D-alanyl-D-alanine carboxypeptidase family protein [Halanaerobiales bacterium]